MCGILGIIYYNKISKEDNERVVSMQEAIIHRGPDNQSVWNDNSVVYGHNRLSIIDLSTEANQPMLSVDKDVVICFNGEIYNYEEVKKELVTTQKFNTNHSDTEVLINAYREWGIEKTLTKLKGMFAFALYDKKKKVNFLVRDRMGKKPLFYTLINKKLFFASEIKALKLNKEIDKTINEEAIYHYLSFLTVNAPNTFYKHIKKLEAGTYIEFSLNGIKKKRYWDISKAINTKCNDSYEKAVSIIKEKLILSMKYRNVSDVPISIALSGGLDSSLNLKYSIESSENISAINLEYEIPNAFNESKIASKYAKELGVNYIQLRINQKKFETELLGLCNILTDMPFGDPNSVLLYYIAKEARGIGSKILLVGEGGDELGGYPVYTKMLKEYNIIKKLPSFIKSILKYIPLAKRFDFFYNGEVVSRRQVHGFTEYRKNKFWKGKKYNSYKILNDFMEEIEGDDDEAFLKKILNIEYKLRLPDLILPRVDYPTMAASIEARSPFMDYELIEYCASLPYSKKMKNGAKSMLKDVAKNVLPNYIVYGKKIGFGELLTPFLTKSLPEIYKKEIIEKENAPIKKYVKKTYLKKLVKKKVTSKVGYRLWIFYSLNKWLLNNLVN